LRPHCQCEQGALRRGLRREETLAPCPGVEVVFLKFNSGARCWHVTKTIAANKTFDRSTPDSLTIDSKE